jgi:hypothetical protein
LIQAKCYKKKAARSNPDEVIGFAKWPNSSNCTEDLSGGGSGSTCGAENLTAMHGPMSGKRGILDIPQPFRPPGTAERMVLL